MSFDLNAKLFRMAQIKKEKPAYRSLIDFYEKIYIEKDWCSKSLKLHFSGSDENYIHLKIKRGFPILDKNAVQFNVEALEGFFHKLLLLSQKKSPDTATKLAKYIQQGNLDFRKTIIELWNGRLNISNYEKEEIGDLSLLSFLLIECIKPVYEYLSQKLKRFIKEEPWKWGYCPICGENPPIAEISTGKSGKILFCIQCGTDWHFPLLRCPFCGYEEEEGIKCFYVENEKQYRIEVCKSCKKYIKVIDVQVIGFKVPLDVENIVTLHLDILAQKKGYRRGGAFHLII